MTRIDGTVERLGDYRGRVLLVVNVASQCGYTPQYRELEALHRAYRDRGFVVLGFPCNQFGGQEPGTHDEIVQFCRSEYDVTFPLFAKIDVNGPATHPIYRHLKREQRGPLGSTRILWNFTKFLVGRDGSVLKRFGTRSTRTEIEPEIVRALG